MNTLNPAAKQDISVRIAVSSVRFSPVPGSYNPIDANPDPDYYINISLQVDSTCGIEAVYLFEKESTQVRLLTAGFNYTYTKGVSGIADQTQDIIKSFPWMLTSLREYAEEKAINAMVEDMSLAA